MKLVVEEKIKTIETSGDENLIFTNEIVQKSENLVTKEKIVKANNVTIEVNQETFLAKVEDEPSDDGYYYFTFEDVDGGHWVHNDTNVDLSEYGITINDRPFDKDKIIIEVIEDEETTLEKQYFVHDTIIDTTKAKLFDFISELPVYLKLELYDGGTTIFNEENRILSIRATRKCQISLENGEYIKIDMWHDSTKDFKIKLVVSLWNFLKL